MEDSTQPEHDRSTPEGMESSSKAALLARLAVGAVFYGLDELQRQASGVPKQSRIEGEAEAPAPAATIQPMPGTDQVQDSRAIVAVGTTPPIKVQPRFMAPDAQPVGESQAEDVRYTLVGLRVVTRNGKFPRPLAALLRVTIGYTLSFLLLGFGFWMVLWTNRRRGLSDIIFHTFKVYSWDARPSERMLQKRVQPFLPENQITPSPSN